MIFSEDQLDELRKFECLDFQSTVSFKDGCIDDFIKSKYWPVAVQEDMIVRTSQQIKHRSTVIVKAYIDNIFNKNFLDFGCGTAHTAIEASRSCKLSVGYDPVRHQYWTSQEAKASNNCMLFNDFDEVKKNGPYDFILLYDVLDHILPSDIPAAIDNIISVCDSNTIIKCRCHPWTSIHGGHLYEKLNKAYAHLLLSEEQIIEHQTIGTTRIMKPIVTYRKLLSKLNVVSVDPVSIRMSDEVKSILSDNNIINRIKMVTGGDAEWQSSVLPYEYVDYVLRIQ